MGMTGSVTGGIGLLDPAISTPGKGLLGVSPPITGKATVTTPPSPHRVLNSGSSGPKKLNEGISCT